MELCVPLLVDDEQLARDELGYLLGQLGGVEVIGQAGNGVEALTTIERLQPDVVFLDVQMPGLTGFEVARRMLDAQTGVAHHLRHRVRSARDRGVRGQRGRLPAEAGRSGAARAGACSGPAGASTSIDSTGDGAMREAAPGCAGAASGINDQLEKIVQLVAERQSRRERLAIKVGERFLLVQAEEIIYASLADESITVVTSQHAGTSNYRTLDELQARLDPDVFWRVHRSHLVNINKIKEIVPWFSRNYILRMKDEKATEIPVSRTQTRRLREYLKL